MIDIRKLKELVRLMVENDLSELDLKDQQETVTVKRGSAPVVHHAPLYAHPASGGGGAAGSAGAPSFGSHTGESISPTGEGGDSRPTAPVSEDTTGLIPINSPMVGTVYLAPNPESPVFANVGSSIGPDTTVCVIEAMKVFSEIKAEVSGTVERVLIQNGKPVQYGQAMFLVRPS